MCIICLCDPHVMMFSVFCVQKTMHLQYQVKAHYLIIVDNSLVISLFIYVLIYLYTNTCVMFVKLK